MKEYPYNHLTGKTLTGIYESRNQEVQDGIPGPASYFSLVIELNETEHYELGTHQLIEWDYREELILSENTSWAQQNEIVVIGRKIESFIQKENTIDGENTLSILLDNGSFIEHQMGNGDQLFIGNFETDFE